MDRHIDSMTTGSIIKFVQAEVDKSRAGLFAKTAPTQRITRAILTIPNIHEGAARELAAAEASRHKEEI